MSGSPQRGVLRDGALGLGLLAIMLLGAWMLSGSDERQLSRSAVGFDGLAAWLRASEVSARTFRGFPQIDPAAVDLRLLPLYDPDPHRRNEAPTTPEASFAAETERDISASILVQKLSLMPTVLILPKWRRGMRLAKAAHPALLVEPAAPSAMLAELVPGIGPLTRSQETSQRIETTHGDAEIYLPQTVAAGPCTPIFGDREEMLFGRCPLRGEDETDWSKDGFWLLTDPDLLNNHGLTRGDNAAIAAAIPGTLGASRPVVDYTAHLWANRQRDEGRQWSDLLEFIGWPFTPFWIGLAAFSVLGLWTGAVRSAPAIEDADLGLAASKAVAIASKARLLRAAGHDAALVGVWLDSRLAAAASALSPSHHVSAEPDSVVLARLAQADPAEATEVKGVLAALRSGIASPQPDPAALLAGASRVDAVIARILT
ncbi:MAG: hypothetical protein AAF698_03080 [Pseudomonadota bacterium]